MSSDYKCRTVEVKNDQIERQVRTICDQKQRIKGLQDDLRKIQEINGQLGQESFERQEKIDKLEKVCLEYSSQAFDLLYKTGELESKLKHEKEQRAKCVGDLLKAKEELDQWRQRDNCIHEDCRMVRGLQSQLENAIAGRESWHGLYCKGLTEIKELEARIYQLQRDQGEHVRSRLAHLETIKQQERQITGYEDELTEWRNGIRCHYGDCRLVLELRSQLENSIKNIGVWNGLYNEGLAKIKELDAKIIQLQLDLREQVRSNLAHQETIKRQERNNAWLQNEELKECRGIYDDTKKELAEKKKENRVLQAQVDIDNKMFNIINKYFTGELTSQELDNIARKS